MQVWLDAILLGCNPGRLQVWIDAILVGCNPGWIQSISKKTNIRAPTCLIQVFGSALRGTLLKEWKSQILLWQHTGSLETLDRIVSRRLHPSNCEIEHLSLAHFRTMPTLSSRRARIHHAEEHMDQSGVTKKDKKNVDGKEDCLMVVLCWCHWWLMTYEVAFWTRMSWG